MHVEVSVALNFVISYLYNKLPRRRVYMFGEELEKGLKKKFQGHWYPDKPFKGSGFRCIPVSGEKTDPVMAISALECGLDIEEINGYLPQDLTLWIDPNEVSYRIGEKGIVKVLYSNKQGKEEESYETLDREIQAASKGFNPEAQSFKPIDSLSSSLTNLSISPSSPTPSSNIWSTSASPTPVGPFAASPSPIGTMALAPTNTFLNRNSEKNQFTTASFAATKFGSTKLKSQAKRPSRLSPTEFNAYMKQRSQNGGIHSPVTPPIGHPPFPMHGVNPLSARPRTLSPRDPRQDFLSIEHQSRMLPSPQQTPPLMGSMNDLYSPAPAIAFNDMLAPGRGPYVNNIPSPDAPNKAFIDGLNLNSISYPANQYQHLLVAN